MNIPALKVLADNPLAFEEVKAVILAQFSLQSLPRFDDMTDQQLGEHVRARLAGQKLVEKAFTEIARHGTTKVSPASENPAR